MIDVALQPETRKPLPQRVCKLLAEEGFRPKLDTECESDMHVSFKLEGRKFLVRFDERDENFVQVCAGVLLDDTSRDELTHLRVAQTIQSETKVVKVFVAAGLEFVEFQMELIVPDSGLTPKLLARSTATILSAWSDYFERVRPEPPRALA